MFGHGHHCGCHSGNVRPYGGYRRGYGGYNNFALIVVLFILLIIVGATFYY